MVANFDNWTLQGVEGILEPVKVVVVVEVEEDPEAAVAVSRSTVCYWTCESDQPLASSS
jgi:hypothetical protein